MLSYVGKGGTPDGLRSYYQAVMRYQQEREKLRISANRVLDE